MISRILQIRGTNLDPISSDPEIKLQRSLDKQIEQNRRASMEIGNENWRNVTRILREASKYRVNQTTDEIGKRILILHLSIASNRSSSSSISSRSTSCIWLASSALLITNASRTSSEEGKKKKARRDSDTRNSKQKLNQSEERRRISVEKEMNHVLERSNHSRSGRC